MLRGFARLGEGEVALLSVSGRWALETPDDHRLTHKRSTGQTCALFTLRLGRRPPSTANTRLLALQHFHALHTPARIASRQEAFPGLLLSQFFLFLLSSSCCTCWDLLRLLAGSPRPCHWNLCGALHPQARERSWRYEGSRATGHRRFASAQLRRARFDGRGGCEGARNMIKPDEMRGRVRDVLELGQLEIIQIF